MDPCALFLLEDSSSSDDSDLEELLDDELEQTAVILAAATVTDMRPKKWKGSTMGRLSIPRNRALGHTLLMRDYFAEEANWECSVLFMINLMHKSWKQIVSVLYREHNQVQAQGPPCSWSFLLATAAMVTSSDAELPSSAERHGRTRECGRPSGVAVGGGATRLSLIRVCELGRGVDVASSDRSPSPRTPPACLNSGVAPLPGATGCSSRCCTPRSRTNPPGALRRRAGSGGATHAGSLPRRGERRGRQRLRGSDGRQGRRRLWGYGRLITETRFVFESARFETI